VGEAVGLREGAADALADAVCVPDHDAEGVTDGLPGAVFVERHGCHEPGGVGVATVGNRYTSPPPGWPARRRAGARGQPGRVGHRQVGVVVARRRPQVSIARWPRQREHRCEEGITARGRPPGASRPTRARRRWARGSCPARPRPRRTPAEGSPLTTGAERVHVGRAAPGTRVHRAAAGRKEGRRVAGGGQRQGSVEAAQVQRAAAAVAGARGGRAGGRARRRWHGTARLGCGCVCVGEGGGGGGGAKAREEEEEEEEGLTVTRTNTAEYFAVLWRSVCVRVRVCLVGAVSWRSNARRVVKL
jgi:hypothetical protein